MTDPLAARMDYLRERALGRWLAERAAADGYVVNPSCREQAESDFLRTMWPWRRRRATANLIPISPAFLEQHAALLADRWWALWPLAVAEVMVGPGSSDADEDRLYELCTQYAAVHRAAARPATRRS